MTTTLLLWQRLPPVVRWSLALSALWAVSFFALPWIAGERAGLFEDDSYFYAQFAYNVGCHGALSFDGLERTSGVHPAWATLLSGGSAALCAVTSDKAIHVAGHTALWFLLIGVLASWVTQTLRQRVVFVLLALLTAPLMETALLSCCLLWLANRSSTEADTGGFDRTLFGVACLLPLVRIDAVPFAALWLFALSGRPGRFRALAVGLALGVLAHLTLLFALYGHLYTVSSLLKADRAAFSSPLRALDKSGIQVRAAVLLLLTGWAALTVPFRRARPPLGIAQIIAGPVAFSFVHLWLSDTRSWYFLPGYTFLFLAATRGGTLPGVRARFAALGGLRNSGALVRRLAGGAVAGVALLLTAYKVYRFVPLDHVRRASWEFVAAAREVVPPGGRIYQIDGSGFTGYWLDRHLINGDGLMNTHAYARRMKAGRLAGYFEERQICFVITDAQLKRRQRKLIDQGGLVLEKRQAVERLRSAGYGWSKNPNAHFVLWRIRRPDCA